MSILKRQVNSSSNLASFYIVMTHKSSVNFKLMLLLLWIKESHQSPTFWDFQILWWIFAIFLMSFSKPKISFSSNFASIFSLMKDNSFVLFYVKHYTLCTIGTNESANCGHFQVLGSDFTKFLSFLKQYISFSSNFAWGSWEITPLYIFSCNFIYF